MSFVQPVFCLSMNFLFSGDFILLRIAHMFAEAARHQWPDKEHATQLYHSLHHTTCATHPPVHSGIYSKHRLMPRHRVANLHVFAAWHKTCPVGESGHIQKWGKSGRNYLKGFPDFAGELVSPAGSLVKFHIWV